MITLSVTLNYTHSVVKLSVSTGQRRLNVYLDGQGNHSVPSQITGDGMKSLVTLLLPHLYSNRTKQ